MKTFEELLNDICLCDKIFSKKIILDACESTHLPKNKSTHKDDFLNSTKKIILMALFNLKNNHEIQFNYKVIVRRLRCIAKYSILKNEASYLRKFFKICAMLLAMPLTFYVDFGEDNGKQDELLLKYIFLNFDSYFVDADLETVRNKKILMRKIAINYLLGKNKIVENLLSKINPKKMPNKIKIIKERNAEKIASCKVFSEKKFETQLDFCQTVSLCEALFSLNLEDFMLFNIFSITNNQELEDHFIFYFSIILYRMGRYKNSVELINKVKNKNLDISIKKLLFDPELFYDPIKKELQEILSKGKLLRYYNVDEKNLYSTIVYLFQDMEVEDDFLPYRCNSLFSAYQNKHFECFDRLLSNNDINIYNKGWTLLHHAAADGNAKWINYLLKHGADAEKKTLNDARNPADIAYFNNKVECLNIFKSKGFLPGNFKIRHKKTSARKKKIKKLNASFSKIVFFQDKSARCATFTFQLDKVDREVIKYFLERKCAAFVAGGYVRDYFLSAEPGDMDIVTSLSVVEIRNIFKFYVDDSKSNHQKVAIKYKNKYYDITTLSNKNDKYMGLYCNSIYRDFTVNALYWDVKNNKLIDFHGGFSDIESRKLNIVNRNPSRFISKNPVIILRAIRFSVTLDFSISDRLRKLILSHKDYLYQIDSSKFLNNVQCLYNAYKSKLITLLQELSLSELFESRVPEFYAIENHI